MSLSFQVNREDMLRSKVLEPGWFKVRIKNISQEPSKGDGSINTIVDFVVVEGPAKDTPLKRWFNEKAAGFIVPFLEALGTKVGESGGNFQLDSAKGKELFVYVKNDMYEGRVTNKVEDFRSLTAMA